MRQVFSFFLAAITLAPGIAATASAQPPAAPPAYQTLFTCPSAFNGCQPAGEVIQGADGAFYGTDPSSPPGGAIFRVTAEGVHEVLHQFDETPGGGMAPMGGLTLARDGSYYGVTRSSWPVTPGGSPGAPTVFKMDASGNVTTVHAFGAFEGSDVHLTGAGLVEGAEGFLFGATTSGGLWGLGTLYRINGNGEFEVVHHFDGSTGSSGYSRLTVAQDGFIYGTTYGVSGNVIFRCDQNGGSFEILHYFIPSTGYMPYGSPIVEGANGWFYGTASTTATSEAGLLYRFRRDPVLGAWTYDVVYEFPRWAAGEFGGYPTELMRGADGYIYFMTQLTGADLFPDGYYYRSQLLAMDGNGNLKVLHRLPNWQANWGQVIDGRDGYLYGGALFRFSVSAASASTSLAVAPAVGIAGTPLTLSATLQSGGLPLADRRVNFAWNWCGIQGCTDVAIGSALTGPDGVAILGDVIPFFGAATATNLLHAHYDGEPAFLAARGSADVDYRRIVPTITWAPPARIAVGTPLGDAHLDARASAPGLLSYTPPAGTVLPLGTGQTLRVDYSPFDYTTYDFTSATVTIDVVNDAPPVAVDGSLTAHENTPATGTLTATDPDGDPLTFSIVSNGSKGVATVTNAATGAFTYSLAAGATGTDSFTFKVSDGILESNTATVTVTITAVASPTIDLSPWKNPAGPNMGIEPDITFSGPLIDGIPVQVTVQAFNRGNTAVTSPFVAFLGTNAGPVASIANRFQQISTGIAAGSSISVTFDWTPNLTEGVTDLRLLLDVNEEISETIENNNDTLQPVTIVAAPSMIPMAMGGVTTTSAATTVASRLLASSPGGLPLTFAIAMPGGKGTASILDPSTGAFAYTPDADAYGYDRFTFTATDANGTSTPAPQIVFIVANTPEWPGQTTRVSVASDGTQGNFGASTSRLSADGRFVAFSSMAGSLVPGDTNNDYDIFVRDRQSGVTERVSVATDGTQGSRESEHPSISADGRYVAFESPSNTLVAGDTNGPNTYDVFVHDRVTGETSRVSVATDGTEGNDSSAYSSISADGRYVAFESLASNLVSGDANGWRDVFVRDRLTGETRKVSLASDGTPGNAGSGYPSVSADGRYVAFASYADNLVPGDTNGAWDAFVHDLRTGETRRVSVASDGSETYPGPFSPPYYPSIGADGRYVVFSSDASTLVANDSNGTIDIFVHDMATAATRRVSVASDGSEGDASAMYEATLSANGRYVSFFSQATNMVSGDTNGREDVFVHDQLTGQTRRVSVATNGEEGSFDSYYPALSADGRFVAFASNADNLSAGDTNGVADIFIVGAAPPRRDPLSSDSVVATQEDTAASGTLVATDPAGGSLTYTLLTTGTTGTATLLDTAAGTYLYTPAPNANGTDTFTFKVNNGVADSNVATVFVTIAPVNDAPVALDGALTVDAAGTAAGSLLANDVDSALLTFSIVSPPATGIVTITNPATGAYTYTASPNASGADNLTFKANDGSLDSNVATVAIAIAQPLGVSVASPNGGEKLFVNVPTTIRWTAFGANVIDVLLSRDGGRTYTAVMVCSNLPGTATSCSWTPSTPGTTTALIRLVARAGSVTAADVSDAAFTITAEAVVSRVDLGTLGGTNSYAVAISESGVVVGSSQTRDDMADHAFVWTETDGIVDLGTLGGTYSSAAAVNDDGVVVGTSQTAGNVEWHAFVWTRARGMVDLGTLGGTQSQAVAINSEGMVIGSSAIAGDAVTHAFVWTETGGMLDLGTLGGANSFAAAVNDSAVVVGSSQTVGDAEWHAFVWTAAGGILDLGTLGGTNSGASRVNDSGLVVGDSDLSGDPTLHHVFAWTAAGGMVDIGTLGGSVSFLKGLNNTGTAVGESTLTGDFSGDTERRAFTWSAGAGLIDVGSLGTLGEVWGVNDAGLIVGDDGARPFGLTTALGFIDLGTIGGDYGIASAVNNSGAVVGLSAIAGNTASHATLWHTNVTGTTLALDGTLVTMEDASASGTLTVSNPLGASLTYTLLTTGTLGTVTLTDATTGAYLYAPAPNANGTDTFTFKVNNGAADSNVATITVTIDPVNDAPVAHDGTLALDANTTAGGTLAAADVDSASLTFSIVSPPAKGIITITNPAAGAYTYTASPNAGGADNFTFKASDGSLDSNGATVAITINPLPLAATVLSPNGGEKVFVNVPAVIRWSVSGAASVDVMLSRNGGGTYSGIPGCTGLSGATTSCSWTPTGSGTTTALVRVTAHGSGSATAVDVSDALFAISTATPSITVTSPNTAVVWGIGSRRTVAWNHNLGAGSSVRIELSRDGGLTWETVATPVQNSAATSGTYSWQVSGPAAANALIRVASIDGPATDVSNVGFAIAAPAVAVAAPNTNVSWVIGSVHTISWTHNLGKAESVRIESSADGGATWTTVTASTPNTANASGSFGWTVTGPITRAARIRVVWTADDSVQDASDVNFRVASRITVTAPNTAVTWGAGSIRTVTWNHDFGLAQTFDVDVSPDGGVTWLPVAIGVPASTATTGTYSGPMPTVVTTQALVRVSPSGTAADGDVSNVPFTLAAPAITVTSPNTNVSWAIGSIHNLTWTETLDWPKRCKSS